MPSQYAHFLEAMPDGVVVVDRAGTVIHLNSVLEKLSGYTTEQLVGQSIETLVPPQYRPDHHHHRVTYARGGMPVRPMGASLDITLQRADGSAVPVDIALSSLTIDGDTFVLASVRDISERKHAEAVILENERRWSELLENVQLAVVGLDLEGRVTYANPYLIRLTGYDADHVIGAHWFEVFVPDHVRGEVRDVFNEVVQDDAHRHHENELLTRRGPRRVISWSNTRLRDLDGNPSGMISIGEDVTDRRRAASRARALNEVAQAILTGGSPDNLLHQVARSAARLVDADAGALLVPLSAGEYEVRAVAGPVMEGARRRIFRAVGFLVERVIKTGISMLIENVQAEPRAPNIAAFGDIGPVLIVALWVRGEPFGALLIANATGGRVFDHQDSAEAEAFASQAAVALAFEQAQSEVARLGVVAERERIARELHDTVIQRLFAAGMALQAAATKGLDELEEQVQHAVEDLDGVIRDIRSTIFTLESEERRHGVRADLLRVTREASRVLGFEARIHFDGALDAVVPPGVQAHAVSTLREALSNVARHSKATRVDVHVTAGDEFTLRVVDDGIGLAPDAVDKGGLGLRNMRERAQDLGGGIDLRPAPGGGTVVEWKVPLGDAWTGEVPAG